MKWIEGDQRRGRQGRRSGRAGEQAAAGDVDQGNGGQTGPNGKKAQGDRRRAEQGDPALQECVVERGVDVPRREGDHLGQWMHSEPNAVAFVPPQRLEIEPLHAQGQAKQQQADQRPMRAPPSSWAPKRTASTCDVWALAVRR